MNETGDSITGQRAFFDLFDLRTGERSHIVERGTFGVAALANQKFREQGSPFRLYPLMQQDYDTRKAAA